MDGKCHRHLAPEYDAYCAVLRELRLKPLSYRQWWRAVR